MMRSTRLVALLAGLLAVAGSRSTIAATDPCIQTIAFGVDTAWATNSVANYLNRAAGQTFVARGKHVHAVTVWRVGNEGVGYACPLRPTFTEVDSTGMPLTLDVVGTGPDLEIPAHDGVHATPFRWVFDPPIALSHEGQYAVFFSSCGCVVDLVTTDIPGFDPGGHLWSTYRGGCDPLRPVPQSIPGTNLVFSIEYCEDVATTSRRSTWGRLKQLYR